MSAGSAGGLVRFGPCERQKETDEELRIREADRNVGAPNRLGTVLHGKLNVIMVVLAFGVALRARRSCFRLRAGRERRPASLRL